MKHIHLERPFHLRTKTWKFGGSVFDTEVARKDKTESPNKM